MKTIYIGKILLYRKWNNLRNYEIFKKDSKWEKTNRIKKQYIYISNENNKNKSWLLKKEYQRTRREKELEKVIKKFERDRQC